MARNQQTLFKYLIVKFMNLDNIKQIEKLDAKKIHESIGFLPKQIEHVLEITKNLKIPTSFKKINQVVLNGMGGSNLGLEIIKAVFENEAKVPFSICPGYTIPASVDANTLFIISSYSGNTEEPLSVYAEVKKRGAKIVAIASDGKLKQIIERDKIPAVIFTDTYNPCKVPRIGLGYSIFGIIALLEKLGLFKIDGKNVNQVIANLNKQNAKLEINVPAINNQAKKLAKELHQKEVVLIGAEFLAGNIHAMRNQFCETGKTFASYLLLPDLNHFAMEGLKNPKFNSKNLLFLFFDSALYHPRINQRSQLTKQVIAKNNIKSLSVKLNSKTKLEQSFEILMFGTWTTYYLGLLNNTDPAPNPWVDWFKNQLK